MPTFSYRKQFNKNSREEIKIGGSLSSIITFTIDADSSVNLHSQKTFVVTKNFV